MTTNGARGAGESGAAPPASAQARNSSWFADLRAKLNQITAVDFLAGFGFASRQQNVTSTGRKTSGYAGSGGGGEAALGAAAGSRSVMNLNSGREGGSMDDRGLLSPVLRSGSEIAASVRHHSDEPRRRALTKTVSKPEENDQNRWSPRHKSEPPMMPRPELDEEAIAEDEERLSSVVPGCPDDIRVKESDGCGAPATGEVQHFGTLSGLVPVGKTGPGVGHSFEFAPGGYPTWCDKCGDFISGLIERQAVRCNTCRFTCHAQCQPLVTLDCRSSTNSLKSEASLSAADCGGPEFEPETAVGDEVESSIAAAGDEPDEGTKVVGSSVDDSPDDAYDDPRLSVPRDEKLRFLIDRYNELTADGLAMTLEDDGVTFRGFLQIHMNFARPINVVSGENPASIYDVVPPENEQDDRTNTSERRKTITSFYLPRNTMKVLHVTSETTTGDMIASLLKKFKVADNPKKFALYERDLEPGKTLQARLVRVPEEARPLRLALSRCCGGKLARFVLQENDTGDIVWDAFEIPELQNFLKILEIEEGQYVKQIERKYYVYRYWLEAEIRHRIASRNRSTSEKNAAE